MSYSQTLTLTCDPKAATKYAQVLLGCFRRGEAEDGPTYVRAVVAILTGYPEPIVRDVCDPRRGLPVKNQFLPTLYEVKSACEAGMRPLIAAEARRRREAEALADRPAPISELAAARRRDVVANMRQRMAADMAATETGPSLHEMDLRHVRGEMREVVAKALDKHITGLTARFRSTPCAPLSIADRGRDEATA